MKYAILVRVLLSWIQTNQEGSFTRFIYDATEPFLKVVRAIMPRTGMIDFSPLVAFFLLDLIEVGVAGLLT